MISSLSSSCPTCGDQNAPGSRFCRHCGAALEGASNAPAANAASANGGADSASVSADIDARRAQQLLERAHSLSDRGEAAGAILAARQSIALAPGVAAGHAMLGRLLERSGDTVHALSAYERALQIAPDPALQSNISRLRDKTSSGAGAAALFHFNDDELFGGEDESLPSVAPVAAVAPVLPAIAEADSLPNIGAAAPGLPSANPRLSPPVPAPPNNQPSTAGNGAGAAVPLAAALVPVPASAGTPAHNGHPHAPIIAAPIVPLKIDNADTRPVNWNSLWAQPSYFGRSLPLVGATIVALGFLSWARGIALAHTPMVAANTGAVIAPSDPSISPVSGDPSLASPNPNSQSPSTTGNAPPANDGFPISNQPLDSGAAPARTDPFSNGPARVGDLPTGNNQRIASVPRVAQPRVAQPRVAQPRVVQPRFSQPRFATPRLSQPRTAPPRFVPSIAPAPIPPPNNARNSNVNNPNAGNGNAGGGNSGDFTLPAPIINSPAPADPPTSVLPSGNTPLNPAGASGRGYVRITQGRLGSSALPTRPSARAGADERAAADAARGGSTDRAIDGLTASINANSSDAGFRFQQRASLFLQRGDYSRAADDFQAAISAYNDQIARGEQVASARAGLRAARGGLNVALAGGR